MIIDDKCVLKTKKYSFDKNSLLVTFNIYFMNSIFMHKLKVYIEKLKKNFDEFFLSSNIIKKWLKINIYFI